MLSAVLGRRYDKAVGIPRDADVRTAIANAERLLPDADTRACLAKVPSTTVHRLVEVLAGES